MTIWVGNVGVGGHLESFGLCGSPRPCRRICRLPRAPLLVQLAREQLAPQTHGDTSPGNRNGSEPHAGTLGLMSVCVTAPLPIGCHASSSFLVMLGGGSLRRTSSSWPDLLLSWQPDCLLNSGPIQSRHGGRGGGGRHGGRREGEGHSSTLMAQQRDYSFKMDKQGRERTRGGKEKSKENVHQ